MFMISKRGFSGKIYSQVYIPIVVSSVLPATDLCVNENEIIESLTANKHKAIIL